LSEIKTKNKTVSQTINLKELFGVNLRGRDELKQAVGQAIIDKIVERTKAGKAVGGKRDLRKPYSEEYQDSLDFKAFGKSKNDVNMTLTGDMLGSIDITEVSGNKVTIGFSDDEEGAKAHGHQTGKNGQVPRMKRPFFGLNKSELAEIKREFKSEINKALKEDRKGDDEFLLGLIDRLSNGNEG